MSDILFVGQDNKKIENFINGLQEIISNKEYDKKEFQKRINIYLNSRKKIEYVEGKVRESYENTIKTTKSPSECTIQIQDILDNTDKNKLLYNLSQHMNELCADGDSLTIGFTRKSMI